MMSINTSLAMPKHAGMTTPVGINPMPGVGSADSVNANVLDVMNPNAVIGQNSEATSEGSNDTVHWKVTLGPCPLPVGNIWSETNPIGSMMFVRPPQETNKRAIPMEFYMGKLDAFIGPSQVQAYTPERVNFMLHLEALSNKMGYQSLRSYFSEYRVAGRLTNIPKTDPSRARSKNPRLSDYYVVDFGVIVTEKLPNYWGYRADSTINCHLFFLLIEVDVQPETMYITDVEGLECRTLGNRLLHEPSIKTKVDEHNFRLKPGQPAIRLEEAMKLRYKPEWVAVSHSERFLPMEKKKYTVTAHDGTKLERFGYAVYIGRCTGNPHYDPASASKEPERIQMRNMQRTLLRGKIDALVSVREYLLN
jgi:hypothetical protein